MLSTRDNLILLIKNKTKQSIKTRLTQNLKVKHTSNAHTKTRREKEKSDRITWSIFPSTPWKNLSLEQTLEPVMRGKN